MPSTIQAAIKIQPSGSVSKKRIKEVVYDFFLRFISNILSYGNIQNFIEKIVPKMVLFNIYLHYLELNFSESFAKAIFIEIYINKYLTNHNYLTC